MKEKPVYSDGYVRLGNSPDTMDINIGLEEAHSLRNTVVTELFDDRLKLLRLGALTNIHNNLALHYKVRAGVKTRSIPLPEFVDEPSVFMGASLSQFSDGRWHMHLVRNRFSRLREEATQQRLSTHYKLICSKDRVLEAKRTVKQFRITLASIAISSIGEDMELEETAEYKRIGFTAPIQPEDCETMTHFITRHCARVKIERGL